MNDKALCIEDHLVLALKPRFDRQNCLAVQFFMFPIKGDIQLCMQQVKVFGIRWTVRKIGILRLQTCAAGCCRNVGDWARTLNRTSIGGLMFAAQRQQQ